MTATLRTRDISDRAVVAAAAAFHDGDHTTSTLEGLLASTGAPVKVCCAAIARAYGRGLVGVGVSIGTAWPTPAGRALLEPKE